MRMTWVPPPKSRLVAIELLPELKPPDVDQDVDIARDTQGAGASDPDASGASCRIEGE